jgi:large subunit ribosomal protein L19
MSKLALIQKLESKQLKKNITSFRVGDTVRVHTRIIEGEKERVQVYTGTVIARKGSGLSETFSVHRVAYGEGMERVFLLHSPRIAKIEVIKEGETRRSKLYYLRGTSGKASKVKARINRRGLVEDKNESNDALIQEATSGSATQTE